MTAPKTATRRSRAMPAFLERKMKIAMAAAMTPPMRESMPSIALMPRPEPAILPILKTAPPMNTNTASTQPRPGSTVLPKVLARMPVTHKTRHTLSWIAMSTRMDSMIANAKDAPICTVKTEVWVKNPGPMAEVAIRNMAPAMAPRPLGGVLSPACAGVACDVSALTRFHLS